MRNPVTQSIYGSTIKASCFGVMLYMQEFDAVMLYAVIFVPSRFLWLALVLPTPVFVRHIAILRRPGYGDIVL